MNDALDDTAENRTELAEDRTLLANERTFSGWVRTSMAAIGVGLGFNVLFKEIDPPWVPKSIGSIFVLLGMFLIVMAERRAFEVKRRLHSHSIEPLESMNLRVVMYGVFGAGLALIAAIWILT